MAPPGFAPLPTVPLRRLRRVPADRALALDQLEGAVGGTLLGAQSHQKTTPQRRFLWPGVVFFATMVCYLLTGLLCVLDAPQPSNSFGVHAVPDDAHCVRVSRHADYASAELPLGSPLSVVSLLLRLDTVIEPSVNTSNAKVFSTRVAESDTVACDGQVCEDIALLQTGGPRSVQESLVFRFLYSSLVNEEYVASTAYELGLRGELRLAYGTDHFLTATHFCWAPSTATAAELPASGVRAQVVDGALRANATDLDRQPVLGATPAGRAGQAGLCANSSRGELGEAALFPGAAAWESNWLGLGSTRLYEAHPGELDDRRGVVELGTDCAASSDEYARAYSLYQIDCLSYSVPCETDPSVPFRHVASTQLRVHIDAGGDARVWAIEDPRLVGLPRLEDPNNALALAVVKLALMALAAGVVWIRAAKATSSNARLFEFCVKNAHCGVGEVTITATEAQQANEDGVIGLLAIVARIGVGFWRVDLLEDDGQVRVAAAQLVCAFLSFAAWLVRYSFLYHRCEAALTKLGGSTAVVDASTAVMLAFAEPPLLVTSIGRFEPTARLLTAILLAMVTLQRCAFSAACCATLFSVAQRGEQSDEQGIRNKRVTLNKTFMVMLKVATTFWIAQGCSVAFLLADTFATPLAYSIARVITGETRTIACAIFFALTAASMPQLVRTAQKIALSDAPP